MSEPKAHGTGGAAHGPSPAGAGEPSADDLLDELVAEYSDLTTRGATPDRERFLERAPPEARPGLERCLKMIDAGTARAPGAAAALAPGMAFGRYRLLREVGRGGMAVVWLARDVELDRPVALKVLRPGLALERRHVERFRREALAIARLRHRHVVQIHDVGEERGYHYLAMEYVEGPSLARVLEALPARRSWSADELVHASGLARLADLGHQGRTFEQAAAALLAPIADALHAAHELGLVHRDVKPSNILLRADGTPVIADFGLAKGESDPALSLTGDPLGTPHYMSPEQAWLSGVSVDHRTDVYSLGVTLYETLSGRRPFDGASALEVFEKIKTSLPPSLRAAELRASRDAAAVVRRAMHRDPSERYAAAAHLRDDLAALAEGRTSAARQDEGGVLRRAWTQARFYTSGYPFEHRSRRRLFGLPLVHVYGGYRPPGAPARVARGWIAIGDVAYGGFAVGAFAAGGIAVGAAGVGILLSFSGLSLSLLVAIGGCALGGLTFGGVSIGYLAIGGIALGYGAMGGFARGVYAAGGNAEGEYVLSDEREDLSGDDWMRGVLPWLGRALGEG